MDDTRDKILSFLIAHIGDLTPSNTDMSDLIGCSSRRIDNEISALKSSGILFSTGKGPSRYFHFRDHEGHTLPRVGKVYPEPPMMRRLEVMDRPQACPWCQVRGCTRHSASRISVGFVRRFAA